MCYGHIHNNKILTCNYSTVHYLHYRDSQSIKPKTPARFSHPFDIISLARARRREMRTVPVYVERVSRRRCWRSFCDACCYVLGFTMAAGERIAVAW